MLIKVNPRSQYSDVTRELQDKFSHQGVLDIWNLTKAQRVKICLAKTMLINFASETNILKAIIWLQGNVATPHIMAM